MIRSILKEELLREADEATYDYMYYCAGALVDEEKFKQKLVLTIKSLKSIKTTSAIPEAVEVMVTGLKEGAELKGFSVIEIGDKQFMVKAKKSSDAQAVDTEATDADVATPEQ
jgi:hypothetical protein